MKPPVTQIQLPTELVDELQERAAQAGLGLEAYIAFLARIQIRQHDSQFVQAAQSLFKTYPEALRELAQ